MVINRLFRGLVGTTAVVVLGVVPMVDAGADTTADAPREVSGFDVNATAGVVDFRVSYPAAFAYTVAGGVLEATTAASGSGFASGVAGPMPVPALVHGGQLYPTDVPNTDIPTPPEGRKAWESIDWHSMPNYCKSDFPDPGDRADRYCGGPASEDQRLGFTAALANGHTKSSGTEGDPLRSAAQATSRGVDVVIPALQATIHDAWASSTSGLNRDGVPEGRGVVELDSVNILNGLIRLVGVHSEAVAVSDGTEGGTKISTSFNLRESFVAGVPVIIGRDGVSVRDEALVPGTSFKDATKQVGEALKQGGMQIRLVPGPIERQGAQGTGQSAGVEIAQSGSQALAAKSFYRFGFAYASAAGVSDDAIAGGEAPVGGDTYQASSEGTNASPEAATASPEGGTTELASPTSGEALGDLNDTQPADYAAPVDISPETGSAGTSADLGGTSTSPGEEVATGSEPAPLTVQLAVPAKRVVPLGSGLPANRVKGIAAALLALAVLGMAALPLRRVL
jgi:hypothetical protein